MIIRYYLQSADNAGYNGHPENVMRDLGFKLISGLPETIADLWFFEVEETDNIPDWLHVMKEERVKTLPEWDCRYIYED